VWVGLQVVLDPVAVRILVFVPILVPVVVGIVVVPIGFVISVDV
jgi:hypothetical protein